MKKLFLISALFLAAVAFPQAGVTKISGVEYRTAPKRNFVFFSGQQNLRAASLIKSVNDSTISAPVGTFTATTVNSTTVATGVTFNGSVTEKYVAKTASYTLTATDHFINFTGDSTSLTLPTAVGAAGRIYIIKNNANSGKSITIKTTSSQTIDGNASPLAATTKKSYWLMSNDANWIIIAAF